MYEKVPNLASSQENANLNLKKMLSHIHLIGETEMSNNVKVEKELVLFNHLRKLFGIM